MHAVIEAIPVGAEAKLDERLNRAADWEPSGARLDGSVAETRANT